MSEAVHSHKGKSSETLLDKKAILKALEIDDGQVIIDAGCGDGYMAKEFSKILGRAGKVYAVDPDSNAIGILKKETRGTNIEALEADITAETKIEGFSVDLVYLSNVFHGFTEKEKNSFSSEIRRLLKPKGRLAIVEIQKEDTPFGPPMVIRYSPEELKREIDFAPLATVCAGEYFYMQIFEKN